ncbi:MAG: hypothetical protein AGIKBDMD_01808 [Synergistaceae bacterium]
MSSSIDKVSFVIRPALSIPTASDTEVESLLRPSNETPPAIGPPTSNIAGMPSLAAAISMPGTILSHDPSITMPSSLWASAIASMSYAIRSLVGSMYFMPLCPHDCPSQAAITPNSTAIPPALYMPFFTNSERFLRL